MENAFHRVALPLPHPFVRCNKSRWPQTSWPLIHQYSYIARRQPQMSQQVSQHGELWWSSSKRWTSLFYILFIIRKLPMPMFFWQQIWPIVCKASTTSNLQLVAQCTEKLLYLRWQAQLFQKWEQIYNIYRASVNAGKFFANREQKISNMYDAREQRMHVFLSGLWAWDTAMQFLAVF